jgi:UDP-2,4-diacetamido-2,4,6-trideoxy-beta-L-altropyranose hydrolase
MSLNVTETLLIRTDGDSEIGTGHVMRSLSLSQAWVESGGEVVFVGATLPEGLRDRIDEWTDELVTLDVVASSQTDACRTTELADELGADWVVVDGRHFDSDYVEAVAAETNRSLLFDDMGERERYTTDIVVNQNLHASPDMYEGKTQDVTLLLGPDYIILRNEFCQRIGWSPTVSETASKLLVTLGGSDPENHTTKVIDAISRLSIDVETLVIAGSENNYVGSLRTQAAESRQDIRVAENVSDMADRMAWADLAVASGGTTCWELAFMGVPAIVGTIAYIETFLIEGLREANLFTSIDSFDDASPEEIEKMIIRLAEDVDRRRQMSSHAQNVVDGHGRDRVVTEMRDRLQEERE